ncbi:MAG: hypothetical protein ACJAUJ_000700 [Salibacteraceae bacterium]|jgi:hypothetical protein
MKKIVLFLFVLTLANGAKAQVLEFDNKAITADFVNNLSIYADAFIGPLLGTYSPALVASNHITAKTLKPFAFGIGISASGTIVKAEQLEYNFNGMGFSNKMSLANPDKPTIPSILGGNTTAVFLYEVEDNSGVYAYQQSMEVLDGFTSINNSVPSAAISLSIGLPMNTEVFVRALPTIKIDGLENYLVGGGVKHVISQYFQEGDEHEFNVALAGFVGKTKFTILPKNFLDGENQEVVFIDNTYSGELIVSYDKKFFSIFGLVGYYAGSSEFAINGTYRYEVQQGGLIQEAFTITNPVNLKRDNSGIQTQIGASLNFSSMGSFALSYAMAESNSVAFNLRFYINNGQ